MGGAGPKKHRRGEEVIRYTTVSTVFICQVIGVERQRAGDGALPPACKKTGSVCVCVSLSFTRERYSRVDAVVSVVCEGPWSKYRI